MSLPPLFLDPHAEAEPTEGWLFGPKLSEVEYETNVVEMQEQDLQWSDEYGNQSDARSAHLIVRFGEEGKFYNQTMQRVFPVIQFRASRVVNIGKRKNFIGKREDKFERRFAAQHDIHLLFWPPWEPTAGAAREHQQIKVYVGPEISSRAYRGDFVAPLGISTPALHDESLRAEDLKIMRHVLSIVNGTLKQLKAGKRPNAWKPPLHNNSTDDWLKTVKKTLGGYSV